MVTPQAQQPQSSSSQEPSPPQSPSQQYQEPQSQEQTAYPQTPQVPSQPYAPQSTQAAQAGQYQQPDQYQQPQSGYPQSAYPQAPQSQASQYPQAPQSYGQPSYAQPQSFAQQPPYVQPQPYAPSQPYAAPQPVAPPQPVAQPQPYVQPGQYQQSAQPYAQPYQAPQSYQTTPLSAQPQPYAQPPYAPQPYPPQQPAQPYQAQASQFQPVVPQGAPGTPYYPTAMPSAPVMTAEQAAHKAMRRVVGRPAALALLYSAAAQVLGGVFMFIIALIHTVMSGAHATGAGPGIVLNFGEVSAEASQTAVQNMGIVSLLSFGTAFLAVALIERRKVFQSGFWVGHYGEARRMRPAWLLAFIVLTVGAQAAATLLQAIITIGGASTASPAMDAINESAVTWQMWLYIGLAAPVFEEAVFRGVLMGALAPYGRNFAIVTSALMFGLYHGDLVQGLFAFVMGLVLGFVAMEYSLLWSIVLHVFNNAVLSGALSELASQFGDAGDTVYGLLLLGVGIIGSIIVLVRYRNDLRAYVLANRTPRGTYWGWTSGWFITFVVIEGLLVLGSAVTMFLG